jgi:TonB-dependent SusC/RagA subfamily outer membrane receptor
MENVAVYLFKYGIWVALFWSVYWFFFRKETFFGFNRFFLLSGLALSFVLASCQYRYSVMLSIPPAAFPKNSPVQEFQPEFAVNWTPVAIGIYLAGVLVLLLHHLRGLNKIRSMIRKQRTHRRTSPSIIKTTEIRSSFSFFGYIFMDKSTNLSEVEKRLILEHETAHVTQRHWVDLLLAQIVCILQWFNPFAWLYLQAVRENHEFLADRSVLCRGNSPAVYHATLINCTLKTPVFALTNSFTYYNNKFKRIAMMKKNVSKSTKKFAVLLLVPAFAAFLSAFATPDYSYSTSAPAGQDKVITDDTVTVIPSGARILDTVEDVSNEGLKDAPFWVRKDKLPDDIVFYVDRKEVASINDLNPNDIHSFTIMKDQKAMELYGKENVILIVTKKHARETGMEENKNKSAIPVGKAKDISDIQIKSISDQLSSVNGQKPLIIVDGKEYSDNMKSINADDIESVSIMKNASATTHYGEKGKGGVVIITTKAAHKAEKRNP